MDSQLPVVRPMPIGLAVALEMARWKRWRDHPCCSG